MAPQENLNPEQKKAVEHIEGPLLVLAGAGSGKTRIVTYRIAFLLSLGVPADEIIAVTFTNKAAAEMRKRVEQIANCFVFTSTFHSLCAHILRESIDLLGFTKAFSIYDEEDSGRLLKEAVKEAGLKGDRGEVRSIRSKISTAKNQLLSPEDLENEDSILSQIYHLYQKKLRESNALDFDDLLFLTVQLFKSNEEVLEKYQNRWSFLLIDEYQDTNQAQYQIAKLLSDKKKNVFAVGDPDQSIYSWRGANIVNILNFERDYPGAQVISLQQNYRSTNTILQAANSLIMRNERKYEKDLWSDLGEGEKPILYYCKNEYEEAQFVVEQINKLREKGILLSECAIFYRTNFQSRIFEDILIKEQIPYSITGGISFYQRKEIKDIIALLRLIHNENDYLSFLRTINLPKRGLGLAALGKIREFADTRKISLLEACKVSISSPTTLRLSAKQRQGLEEYLSLFQLIKDLLEQGLPLAKILNKAIHKWGYLNILKADPETFEDRSANVAEFIAKASQWTSEEEGPSLTQFLEDVSLKSERDEETATEKMHLMTLHNSKGLEFSAVFLAGMEEELFPHANCKDAPESIEEERRLCYVGMTRAKQHLYLTSAQQRFLWGFSRYMRPSRFINEISQDHLHSSSIPEGSKNEGSLVGKQVSHSTFGKGMITKIYETSYGLTYDVFFSEQNAKRSLVAKFAKLSFLS